MTRTTNDAIALAREIGLRYLWIDALCIIQDDKDDWLRESSQMNLVYRHAFVAFCSLNSNSCHESFLNKALAIEVPFQSTIRKGIKGSYLIRLRSVDAPYTRRKKYAWDKRLSKWGKRCWTHQEEEMSTRLILFGNLKMHFSCAKYKWSEGDEAPRPRSTRGVMDQIIRFRDGSISSKELYQFWSRLVHKYGYRTVTFEKDRLPAIAGLARMVGETLQDQYLAGLWKGDLIYGLAWYSSGDMLSRGLDVHIRNIRERAYVAPSWSWAACPAVAVVRYPGARIVEESTVVNVNTDTNPKDPYGQVSGGYLRMHAKMAGMPRWLPTDQGTRWLNTWYHIVGDDDAIQVITDWLHKDEEIGLEILVLMLLHRIERENETEEPSLRALLLHPAGEADLYYRVGVAISYGHEACRVMKDWFDDSQEETICII
ncbi:heterokaryon incompatibility protein-domain-containing protein [Alternaria rosae]|uniref:heterokaryon incompatibility protein-domain-containing protein n=1 Tax=Alternaria rosae TaxID=1187941 RepID=UPI001E8D78BD|nr:heterokaryon incompatibility protein-domain-containing protein [Alternaria rosae]KAH6876231.1 heterokaryon incompatibility protein-domain-containing protein [Alternaria rosae]